MTVGTMRLLEPFFTVVTWLLIGWLLVLAKRRLYDPAAANARRIRHEAREVVVGPEGSPELGVMLDGLLAPGQPVIAIYSVSAQRNPLAGKYLAMFIVACFFPPTLIIILFAIFILLLASPFLLAWLLYSQTRALAVAPAGGLGDLLVFQPGRLTLLQGVIADPRRGVFQVRDVLAMPRATSRGWDLALTHEAEGALDRLVKHVHLKHDGVAWNIAPFGQALNKFAELPLDRLPPRYRERLRPFRQLPADLAGWEGQERPSS